MEIDNDTLKKLALGVVAPSRLQELAGLAGAGLQTPYATLRRREAQRELARIEMREGAKSLKAMAQAKVVVARVNRESRVQEDYARRAAPMVDMDAGQASLAGKITRDGVALSGISVLILSGDKKAVARSCTGRDGRYGVAVPADSDLTIELRDDGILVYQDTDTIAFPPAYRGLRDIEIGKASPTCNQDGPDTSGAIQMPNLVGLEIKQAIESLKALGVQSARFDKVPSDRLGVILAQRPAAASLLAEGVEVILQIGEVDDRLTTSFGDVKGGAFDTVLNRMAEKGVAVASVTVVAGAQTTATLIEAVPTVSGNGLHLTVEGGDVTLIIAELIAQGVAGKALGLDKVEAARKWLDAAKINGLDDLKEVASVDDSSLRKRLGLSANAKVADQRGALFAVASIVREG